MWINNVQGGITGTVIDGDGNTVHTVQAPVPDDLKELLAFVRAAAQALPVLDMEARQREEARTLAAQIIQDAEDPGADRGRLAALGASLHAVLTQTGSNALSGALLSLWAP
ncbi:hypothetical protein ACIBF1_10015 [Spirillospora sp. NPDC050679]